MDGPHIVPHMLVPSSSFNASIHTGANSSKKTLTLQMHEMDFKTQKHLYLSFNKFQWVSASFSKF